MTKDVGILILGLVVAMVPFLGIPSSWKTVMFVASGLAIAFHAFLLRGDLSLTVSGKHTKGERRTDTFAENGTARTQMEVGDGIKKISEISTHEVELKAERKK